MKTSFKVIIVSILTLLCSTQLNAQNDKVAFGVKAGMNVSTLSGDVNGADAKVGFNVGVTLDYAFTENLYLLTGLDFTQKGAKFKGAIDEIEYTGDAKLTLNPMYLQIPIHVGYKFEIAENTKLVIQAGPYLAYGVAGKAKAEASGVGSEKVGVFRSGLMKNFDFGLGLGTGVEFGKIGVKLGYDFGVINVWDADGVSVRNGNFHVGVGYKF